MVGTVLGSGTIALMIAKGLKAFEDFLIAALLQVTELLFEEGPGHNGYGASFSIYQIQ